MAYIRKEAGRMARPGWPTFNYGAAPASPDHHAISPRSCSTGRAAGGPQGERLWPAIRGPSVGVLGRAGSTMDGQISSRWRRPWRLCRATPRCMLAHPCHGKAVDAPQDPCQVPHDVRAQHTPRPQWSSGAWQDAIAAAVENAPLPNPHRPGKSAMLMGKNRHH